MKDKNGKRIKNRSGAKSLVMQPQYRARAERKPDAYHRPSAKRAAQQES